MPIDQIARLGIRVEAEGPDAARRKLDAMERSGSKAERTVESLGRSSDKASGRIQTMATSSNLLAGALAAVGAALSIREIVQYTDTWTNLTNRLRLVTDTSQELVDVQQSLVEIAFETRGSLDSTAVLYQRLAQSAGELFDGQEDILAVTKTISQAMLVSGASAQESAGALRQLAQGLASGVLRGDEFNSVMENAPRLQQALIDHLNLTSDAAGSAAGKLRDMAGEGELSARTLVEAFQAAATDIDAEALKLSTSMGQSLEQLNSGITATIGQLDGVSGASESVAGSISSLAQVLIDFSTDADAVRDVANGMEFAFTAVAAILAGKFAGAIGKQVTQMGLLNAATYKTTIQTNSLGQVISRTTVATKAATVAAAGLRTAFAFLGGPVGVITLAVTSLIAWNAAQPTTEEKAESLKGKIDELAESWHGLTEAQRINREEDALAKRDDIKKELEELTKARDLLRDGGAKPGTRFGFQAPLGSQDSRVKDLTDEIDSLNQELINVDRRISELGKPKSLTDGGEPLSLGAVSGNPGANSADIQDDLPALEQALQEHFERVAQSRLDTVENLRQSLLSEEEALTESYRRRNRIIEENVQDPAKREELLQRNQDQFNEEIDARLQGLRESWLSEREILLLRQDEEMETLDQGYISKREILAEHLEAVRATEEESRQASLALEGEYQRNLTALEAKHAKQREKLDETSNKNRWKSLSSAFDMMLGISSTSSEKLFKIQRSLSLAKAVATLPSAIIESYNNSGGYPWGIPAAIAMAAAGAAQISQIQSASFSSGSASAGSVAGGVSTSAPAGGLTSPSTPLATSDPTSTSAEQQAGTQVIFNIAGDVNGDNAERVLEQIKELINEQDVVFIDSNSRQAQELAA
ncbi:tape measure protein [Microbulbifer sp. VVAC002]|uniref:tape measure protein n=1 Tax=Microbulbifer sp. VVAC002 TaxID=3243387 RepID=UPI00403A5324